MSKTYDEGYQSPTNPDATWVCNIDSAAETHSDYTRTEAYSIFGGQDDRISSDLTVAQLNSPEFGVTFKATAGSDGAIVRVDSVKVKVFYRQLSVPLSKESRRPVALAGVAVLGNRFVVVGANGRVLTSDDNGQNWVDRDSGALETLWQVRQIAGVLYAVGDNGIIITSTDGETWVRRESGTKLPLRCITSSRLNVIVSGRDGISLISKNQHSWSPV